MIPYMNQSVGLPLSRFLQNFIFASTIILLSVGQLSTDIYLPSVPSLIHYFSISTSSLQLTISLYFIGYGISQLFYGPLSDHFGRRPIILFSLSTYLFGTLLCMSAKNFEMLLLGRIIQGAGIGAAGAISAAIPHDIFSGKKIAQAFGIIGIAISITPLITPVLGGYLQSIFDWRASFIFLFSYALIFLCLIFLKFPETNPRIKATEISFLKIIKAYFRILGDRIYFNSLLCLITILLGEILFIVWMPIIIQVHFKQSPISNGWIMIFPALGLAFGSYISSKLSKSFRKNRIIMSGMLSIFASCGLLYLCVNLMGLSIQLVSCSMTLYMIGSGIAFPLCIATCIDRFSQTPGTAGALMSAMLMSCSGLLSSILIKTNIMHFNSLPFVLLISSSLLVLLGLKLVVKQDNLLRH